MEFHQASDPSYLTEPPITFSTNQVEVFIATDISEALNDLYEQLIKKIDEFQEKGSGWVVHGLLQLDFTAHAFVPLRGSTYIPLPDELRAKRGVVSIQNEDDKCFI